MTLQERIFLTYHIKITKQTNTMSQRYGIMPEKDYDTLDKTLQMVHTKFHSGVINTCEIGVHKGNGSRGIHKFFTERNRINFHTAIDNQHDLPIGVPFEGCNLVIGNSIEVYNQVPDNSQHFLLIDGCHNYPMTMADFLVYSGKVKVGGYVAFHDTGEQIKPMTDYQGMGSKDDPDMYISCRKAVQKLGLLGNPIVYYGLGWDLILDEYDPKFHTGGIIVVQKLF